MVVLMIVRPVLRSAIVRASEIGKRRNLCGYPRWGRKCGCQALSFNQEQGLLFEAAPGKEPWHRLYLPVRYTPLPR